MKRIISGLVLSVLIISELPAASGPSLDEVDSLIKQARYEWALEVLSTLSKEEDSAGLVSFRRARVHFRMQEFDEAESFVKSAIKQDEKNASFHALKGAIHAGQINNAGMFSKMSLAGKIKDSFKKAVELAPDNVSYRENLLGYYVNAPGIAGGSTKKAREQARAIAELDPAAGYRAGLLIHFSEKETDEAQAYFREAASRFPQDSELYAAATTGFGQLEAYDNAHEAVLQWRENLPSDAGALYQHGRLAAVSGQFLEQGEAAMRQYLTADRDEGDPPLYWAHYRLGLILQHKDDHEDAERQFEIARRQGKDDEQLMGALSDLE